VVKDWTPECQREELIQRSICDIVLYVITSEMEGVYSIAEAVDDSNKRPSKTILCVLEDGFSEAQKKSLKAVCKMITSNGSMFTNSLEDTANLINSRT